MIRVSGIKMALEEDPDRLKLKVAKKLRLKENQLLEYRIFKQSIDARKPGIIYFVYTVDAAVANESPLLAKFSGDRDVSQTPQLKYEPVAPGTQKLGQRPIIIGSGPAGLFAGLILSAQGYAPLLLERGPNIDTRAQKVARFWETGELDPEANVQFGEGGAGSFSDGKLTTLIRDPRCRKVLEELVEAGAPPEIMYSYKPHVGTDVFREVIKKIRRKIIAYGGEVRFNCKVTDITLARDAISGVVINETETCPAQAVMLAVGHSARDTFARLLERGVKISPKPFSIGLRIEHPQPLIDLAQFKELAGHPRLGAADYKLSYHSPTGRSAYTFCMCPGGYVVAAASEAGGVVTNGMSNYARDAQNANSALLVGVKPGDFQSAHPLAGVEFQRRWERQAYVWGGKNYQAPVQLLGDFLLNRPSRELGAVTPTYSRGFTLAPLNECLPDYVVSTLKEAATDFGRKLKGFDRPDAVLTGVETRSSSPVRIERDSSYQTNVRGLYPAGEGAGYAGGIISAAVDGIKVAEAIIAAYQPLKTTR